MMFVKSFGLLSAMVLGFVSYPAISAIDPAASVVLVRTSCDDGGGGTLNNCFTDFSSLNSWIWGTRQPTRLSPLEVDIGPGTYGQYACGDAFSSIKGYISFRGAGIDRTTIASVTLLAQCANVSFSDMTIGGTGINYSVVVVNPGTKTTWTSVRLASPNLWAEYCAGAASAVGKHYWFGSRLEGSPGGGYQVKCDESWFYGSEITLKGSLASGDVTPFKVSGNELHVYGSVIRALGTGTTATYPIKAVEATGGETHIHGTGIDTIAIDGAPATIVVLDASNGATIHANVTAYNIKNGNGGSVTRVSDNASHVHAPYQWQHIPDPATIPNFSSINGADFASAVTGTSDGYPHAVIYSSTCPQGARWYDQVDKVCRSQ